MPTSTLTGVWPTLKTARIGPFIIGSSLYIVTRVDASSIQVSKSTDGGMTWSVVATRASTPLLMDAVLSGSTIYIAASVLSVSQLAVIPFDTLTDTFGTATSSFAIYQGSTTYSASLAVRSTGEFVVVHQIAATRIMGVDYRQAGVSRWNGSSWTTLTLGPGGSTHYDPQFAILGANDRVHLFYTGTDTLQTSFYAQTLRAANTFATAQAVGSGLQGSAYPVGVPHFDGTTVMIPYVDASGVLMVAHATSADSPTWATSTVSDTGNGPETTNASPGAVAHDGTNWHIAWPNDAQNVILTDTSANGTTWGTDVTVAGNVSETTFNIAPTRNNAIPGLSGGFGQSFTATASTLDAAILYLRSDVSGGEARLVLATDQGGSGVLSTSSTLTLDTLYNSRRFEFSTHPALTIGSTYYLIVQSVSGGTLGVSVNDADPYAEGAAFGAGIPSGTDITLIGYPFGSIGPVNGISSVADSTGLYTLYDNNGTITLDYPSTGAETGTTVRNAITVTGRLQTGTAQISAIGTMTTDAITVTGRLQTGTATVVVNALGATSVDAITETGRLLTGTAGSSAFGTTSADLITEDGRTLTAAAFVLGTTTRDSVSTAGRLQTGTAAISALGSTTADPITVTGRTQSGTATLVVSATGTTIRDTLAATGRAGAAQSATAAISSRDMLAVAGRTLAGTGVVTASGTTTRDSVTTTGRVLTGAAAASDIGSTLSDTVVLTERSLTATAQRNETGGTLRDAITSTSRSVSAFASVLNVTSRDLIAITPRTLTGTGQRNMTGITLGDVPALSGRSTASSAAAVVATVRDALSVDERALAAAAQVMASATTSRQALTVDERPIEGTSTSAQESITLKDALSVTGRTLTATAQVSSSATVDTHGLAAGGRSLAASAGSSVVSAYGPIGVDGHTMSAKADVFGSTLPDTITLTSHGLFASTSENAAAETALHLLATVGRQVTGTAREFYDRPIPDGIVLTSIAYAPAISFSAVDTVSSSLGLASGGPSVFVARIENPAGATSTQATGPAVAVAIVPSATATTSAVPAPGVTIELVPDPPDQTALIPGPRIIIATVAHVATSFSAVPDPSGSIVITPGPAAVATPIHDAPAVALSEV